MANTFQSPQGVQVITNDLASGTVTLKLFQSPQGVQAITYKDINDCDVFVFQSPQGVQAITSNIYKYPTILLNFVISISQNLRIVNDIFNASCKKGSIKTGVPSSKQESSTPDFVYAPNYPAIVETVTISDFSIAVHFPSTYALTTYLYSVSGASPSILTKVPFTSASFAALPSAYL